MKHKLFFILSHLFLLWNCSSHKQAEPVAILKHQAIDLGEEFVGYGGFLTYNQGVIAGIELSPAMQPFFCIKPNGARQTLSRFGSKGQGPEEFITPYSIQHINSQTIGVFDPASRTFNEFHIPNENEDLKINNKVTLQVPSSRVIKTAFNQYIGLTFEEKIFVLADSTGIPIQTFFEYPYKDNEERQFATRSHAYQGTLVTNPSKNKLVYASFQGDIIHFYQIEDSNIKPVAKIENEYPSYKKRDDNYEGVIADRNGTVGYIATYATDHFVYAIYSGIKTSEIKSVNFEGQTLRVFNWEGILVKEYNLDLPCSYLCVSDDDSKMWAIASNPEITFVRFDLINTPSSSTYTMWEMPKPKGMQPVSEEKVFIFEIVKDGMSDEEKQKVVDLIKKQMAHDGKINIENSETKLDTLDNNTVKVSIILK